MFSKPMDGRRVRIWVALAVVVLLAAGAAAAQTKPFDSAQGKKPLTVEDLWAAKRPGAPSLSPDGKWAAVEITSYSMAENNSTSDIWLLATDGSSQRKLTTHSARDSAPQWSLDGQWIAFTSKREGDEQTQVYLISPTGGEAKRLTKVATGVSGVRWFADSKSLAFISWVWPELKTDEEQAKKMKEQKDAKVKAYVIDQTTFRYWDHWIADGRVPHVFVANVETSETRDVLGGAGVSLTMYDPGGDSYDISPDGKELAFVGDTAKDFGYRPNADVLTIPVAGGTWKNLTEDNKAGDGTPRYSPDGKWLAYTRNMIPSGPDRDRVVLLNRATAAKTVLTEKWDRSAGTPVWSPDSQKIYFTAEDQARVPVWVLSVSGGDPKPAIQGGTNSSVDLSGDGKTVAFVRTTMNLPPTVFAAAADGSGEKRIETFNAELEAQWQLGEVKSVTYAGWSGNQVQMWVIYPPNFDPKKKWPLLQIVHGGPHGAWMDQFHFRWNMQAFAAPGYVVAAVNFHGSTGWGDAFTDANTARYGATEMVDVENGTDYLIKEGYIDTERMAAAGGSYGGYMVAWMNGHTNRYKAYVCHAGVYDWVAQTASDYVRGRDRALGGFPWEAPEKVLGQSAHTFAKNFKTPTLVVHGEQDFRVPLTQGLAYYTTLRMLGVPTRLVYFPDENHWVLKAQNSRLWYAEFFGWIGKYAAAGGR